MFSVGGTVLKEKDANAKDQTGLPDGAGGAEGVRKGFEHEERNREIFEDDGQLDSAGAQNTSDLMEVAGILASGRFDDLEEDELSKIDSPIIRAKLQQQLQAKKSEQIARADMEARRQAWDAQDHDFGGKTWKPQELRAFLSWSKDPKNLDKVDKELVSKGYSKDQVKTMRQKFEDARDLQSKEAEGKELTKEEKARLETYKKDPDVVKYTAESESRWQQDKDLRKDHSVNNTLSRTASSENQLASGGSLALAELDKSSGGTIAPVVAKHSLGKALQTDTQTGIEESKLVEPTAMLREEFTLAAKNDPPAPEPSNGLSEKFKQANIAEFPLDQDDKPRAAKHPAPIQVAMAPQAAAGLSF